MLKWQPGGIVGLTTRPWPG